MAFTESFLESLPFPASVYARAQIAQGMCDLGFGLFQDPQEDFQTARKRLIDRVLHYLPDPPAQTLIYSSGLGELTATAIHRGYRVKGVFPEPAHRAVAAERCPVDVVLPAVRWESLTLDRGRYEAILFHESSRSLDPLILFGKAYRALTEGGILILLDEFAAGDFRAGHYQGRHRLPYLLSLARRCGFELQDQEDLSNQASLTLDYYQRLLSRHEQESADGLQWDRQKLAYLKESNQRDRRAYIEGRQVYQLLRFSRQGDLRWRVSHVDPSDFSAVSGLFQQVFEQALSPQLWQWKYGEGRGQGSIAWAGDRVVAHYGGITRPIVYFGRPEKACQVADVMVDQSERGVLTRKGPFFLTAASLPEACSGYGAKHLIGYGFPNARAMRVAVKLGLYAKVGHIVEVFWTPYRARPSLLTRMRPLTHPDRVTLDPIVAPLWRAMSDALKEAIVGIRDANWIYYRYLSHPHHDYHLWVLTHRFTQTSLGLIVLRRDGRRCELLDVIAPLNNIPLLIHGARRIAAQWQANELYCWISSSYASLFERCEGQRRDPDVAIPTSIWTDAPAPEELCDRWWLMSGDTDFH